MTALVTGNARTPVSVRGDDLYETPEIATRALLKAEKLPEWIWEPACGRGAIVRVLREAGHKVLATDLVDYDSDDQDVSRLDFLMQYRAPEAVQAIVTNPPFKNADAFVAKALVLCPKVVMLLRLAFLESTARTPILDSGQLARVHVFRKRLPMMHRDGWTGPKETSAMAFAWFVWDREHSGATELYRI